MKLEFLCRYYHSDVSSSLFLTGKRQTCRKVIDILLYQISKLGTFIGQIVHLTVSQRTKLTKKFQHMGNRQNHPWKVKQVGI